ncbi:MAG: hypothetical protein FJZ43_00860 [Candidatus Staskawiczbacteria bacterium]|nr:hypothetical protein [Candidatus Staskawiczbacteria bacterium]
MSERENFSPDYNPEKDVDKEAVEDFFSEFGKMSEEEQNKVLGLLDKKRKKGYSPDIKEVERN